MPLPYWLNLVVLAGIATVVIYLLVLKHNAPEKSVCLIDLVTARDGTLSRPAVMELGAFVTMTWGFIVLVNTESLTEWYSGVYVAAFVMRAAYSAFLRGKK